MSLPYFNLYPADFEADTSHLSMAEDGAYNRLLRLMWMTPGCSLPDDDAWIRRRMRASAEEFETVVLPVIAEFFVRKNGRIVNPRLRREFEKADETYRARSAAGKKGGRPKAVDNKADDAKAGLSREKAGPKQPEPEPEPEPVRVVGSNEPTARKRALGARDHLEPVIGPDLAAAFCAHRTALKAPMTPHAGKLMAAKLAAMPDPAAAVTLSLERGWKGVFESPPNVTPFPARPAVPAFDLEAFKRDNPEFG